MKLERECSFHVVLRLKVHLQTCFNRNSDTDKRTYIDKLVDVLDIYLVPSNSSNEIHQAKLMSLWRHGTIMISVISEGRRLGPPHAYDR